MVEEEVEEEAEVAEVVVVVSCPSSSRRSATAVPVWMPKPRAARCVRVISSPRAEASSRCGMEAESEERTSRATEAASVPAERGAPVTLP